MSEPPLPSTLGCILAGGLSRRMGGSDKALISLGGKPLLAHVVDRLRPQVPALIVNANGEASRFASFDVRVLPDTVEGFQGPLAGVLSALRHATRIGLDDVLTMATDTPFAPPNLARRLHGARSSRDGIALASSGGRVHPVVGLWPVALADDLEDWLRRGDERSVRAWAERHPLTVVDFPFADFDPFFNVNTQSDLAEAERRLAEMRRS
ncbi:MAG: molybdenum cofactor guanylyltransferase MobA [Pararhizobium sp.]